MKRTQSRQKHSRKNISDSDKKTQRKKPKMGQFSKVTKSTIWLDKQKIPIFFKQQPTNQTSSKSYSQLYQYPQQKYLPIRNALNIKMNRAKAFDWLLGVCASLHLRWQTYWCTIQLIDYLIQTSHGDIKINKIHLIFVTCLFISCKLHQTHPPYLDIFIKNVVYNQFTNQQIKQMQSQIILFCANNNQKKPTYLYTIYNTLYDKYSQLDKKYKIQVLRRFVLIWMDPVMALNRNKMIINQITQMRQSKIYTKQQLQKHIEQRKYNLPPMISYNDLVDTVVKNVIQEYDGNQRGNQGRNQSGNQMDQGDGIGKMRFQNVYEFYKNKYDCSYIQEHWVGLHALRI